MSDLYGGIGTIPLRLRNKAEDAIDKYKKIKVKARDFIKTTKDTNKKELVIKLINKLDNPILEMIAILGIGGAIISVPIVLTLAALTATVLGGIAVIAIVISLDSDESPSSLSPISPPRLSSSTTPRSSSSTTPIPPRSSTTPITMDNSQTIKTLDREVNIIPIVFKFEGDKNTDFVEMIANGNKKGNVLNNSLFIYNENFSDYTTKSMRIGGGNAKIRPYRMDNGYNDKVKYSGAMGIPTGIGDLEHKCWGNMYNLIILSINNIVKILKKNEHIDKVFYSADNNQKDQIGIAIFNRALTENIKYVHAFNKAHDNEYNNSDKNVAINTFSKNIISLLKKALNNHKVISRADDIKDDVKGKERIEVLQTKKLNTKIC